MPASPTSDRYAGLRAHAAARRQATVDRLAAAIAALEAAGRPVSASTIKQAGGLDYMAYRRNPEAYALYRRHSTRLRAERERATRRRHRGERPAGDEAAPPRDRLLDHPKRRLAADLRAARAERDEWARRYRGLVQEHMQCGLTIARLEAQLAEHQRFLARFRGALGEETGTDES